MGIWIALVFVVLCGVPSADSDRAIHKWQVSLRSPDYVLVMAFETEPQDDDWYTVVSTNGVPTNYFENTPEMDLDTYHYHWQFMNVNFSIAVYDQQTNALLGSSAVNVVPVGIEALKNYQRCNFTMAPEFRPVVTLIRQLSETFFVAKNTTKFITSQPISALNSNPLLLWTRFEHHKAFSHFQQWYGPLERDYITDFLGIRTKREWDCGGWAHGYNYYDTVPSRAIPCEAHRLQWQEADLVASSNGTSELIPVVAGVLPLVDDEYFEWADCLESVIAAGDHYVIMEIGARFATWGVRGAVAHRQLRPDGKQTVVAVELDPALCEWCSEHGKANNVQLDLHCERATPKQLIKIMQQQPHVDLLDFDIQGAEWEFFNHTGFLEAMFDKVRFLHVGVHSTEIRDYVVSTAQKYGWQLVLDLPYSNAMHACDALAHGSIVYESDCHTHTKYGPVYVRDGAVAFVHPSANTARFTGWEYANADIFSTWTMDETGEE